MPAGNAKKDKMKKTMLCLIIMMQTMYYKFCRRILTVSRSMTGPVLFKKI